MREVSMYGDEEALLSPDEVVSREEAERAVEWARKAHEMCSELLTEIKAGKPSNTK